MKANATSAEETATEEKVQILDTSIVLISAHNTRQPTEKEVTASGLLESIKAQGQLTPGLGRPHPDKPGHIELAAGACRRVACAALKIPYKVIVRPMTDGELLDAILTENLQRTNPEPEAEADLIQLRLSEGMTPGEICAKYGKDEIWIRRRMKILSIIPKIRKMLKPGGKLAHFTTIMKERVGDMAPEIQERMLAMWNFDRATSLEEINRCFRSLSCSLEGQTWIDDPDTAIKGCGPGCANNDSNSLFPDPHTKSSCGNCLNSTCFKSRLVLAQQKSIRTALGDLKITDVVLFSKDYCNGIEFEGKTYRPLDSWDFKDLFTISKKPTERIGLNVTDLTNVKRVYLIPTAKNNGKSDTGKASSSGKSESREDKLTGKRLAAMNAAIKEHVTKSSAPESPPILHIVAAFGLSSSREHCMGKPGHSLAWTSLDADASENVMPFGHNETKKLTRTEVLWKSIIPILIGRIYFQKNSDLLSQWKRDEMTRIASLTGLDYEAEWKKICTEQVPVPKSWGPGIDPITLKRVVYHATIPGSGKTKLAKAALAVPLPAKKAAKKAPKKAAKKAKK